MRFFTSGLGLQGGIPTNPCHAYSLKTVEERKRFAQNPEIFLFIAIPGPNRNPAQKTTP
jgi:hypothetical protein